jgi:hypothetical protein
VCRITRKKRLDMLLEKERKKTKKISDFNLNDCMTSDAKVTEFSASSKSPCFVSRVDRIIEFLGVGLEISTHLSRSETPAG